MSKRRDEGDRGINLDFYHATRKGKRRSTWPYLVSAVLMLITLVVLVMFRDSCGSTISESVFGLQK